MGYFSMDELYVLGHFEEQGKTLKHPQNKQDCMRILGMRAIEVPFYQELFDALKRGQDNLESVKNYMHFFNRMERVDQEKLWTSRKNMYIYYKYALKNEMSFFEDSPIRCRLDDGKMCVIDGFHRLFFLLSEDFTKVPIVTTKEDFKIVRELYPDAWS